MPINSSVYSITDTEAAIIRGMGGSGASYIEMLEAVEDMVERQRPQDCWDTEDEDEESYTAMLRAVDTILSQIMEA